MKLTWMLFVVLQIQLFIINPSDGKSDSKKKASLKSNSKPTSKSASSKMASTVRKVASSLTKPKIGGGIGGLKAQKAIPLGAAVAGGTLLLPFLMRKKFKRRRIIPAFIGRHRSDNGYGMQCYLCEGMDNDGCVISPVAYASHVTCGPGQYCNVLRREIRISSKISETTSISTIIQPDESDTELTRELDEIDETSAFNRTFNTPIFEFDKSLTSKPEMKNSSQTNGNVQVFVSRGCNSPESLLQTSSQYKHGDELLMAKISSQFCLADLCNTGDGNLKCYQCEGEGLTHPCMINPTLISGRVTCEASQYCNILRLVTMAYFPTNDTTVNKVTIVRGCSEDEEYEEQDGISLQSLSCSSDYCNGVDGNHLTYVNASPGRHKTTHVSEVIMSFVLFSILAL